MKNTKYSSQVARAFTLVELMVVIAVMAVLVMILLPTLQRAREHARSTSCQNNLRQYGTAMGRYMSDWKGYFIYPGDQAGGAARSPGSQDMGDYKAGVYSATTTAGGIPTSEVHDWQEHFIDNYVPDQITLDSLSGGKPSVRVCPSVLQELRAGNYFDPDSPNFKGTREDIWYDGTEIERADFQYSYDATTEKLILQSYFTTYAINPLVYHNDRKNISANTIAFIDWNAKEGWWADLYHNPNTWQFTGTNRNPSVSQDQLKWTTNWCLTEVGFYHKDGTNAYANYVAMDGHVASVTSNEINRSYFESTGPR